MPPEGSFFPLKFAWRTSLANPSVPVAGGGGGGGGGAARDSSNVLRNQSGVPSQLSVRGALPAHSMFLLLSRSPSSGR